MPADRGCCRYPPSTQDPISPALQGREEPSEGSRAKGREGFGSLLSSLHGALRVALAVRDGSPLSGLSVLVKLGHPVTSKFDRELTLLEIAPGLYEAPAQIDTGTWDADVTAQNAAGDTFRLVHRFNVSG